MWRADRERVRALVVALASAMVAVTCSRESRLEPLSPAAKKAKPAPSAAKMAPPIASAAPLPVVPSPALPAAGAGADTLVLDRFDGALAALETAS